MKKLIALASVVTLVAGSSVVFGQCFHTNSYGYQTQVSCGSGGGGSSNLQRDYCPDGDNTLSYYDGMCDEGVASSSTTGSGTSGSTVTTTTTNPDGTITTVVTNPTVTPSVTTAEENTVQNLLDNLTNNAGGEGFTPPTFVDPSRLPDTGASL